MGGVDIGTEWNLKYNRISHYIQYIIVDIGTEWNLKDFDAGSPNFRIT